MHMQPDSYTCILSSGYPLILVFWIMVFTIWSRYPVQSKGTEANAGTLHMGSSEEMFEVDANNLGKPDPL